jgi:hypothetical protein
LKPGAPGVDLRGGRYGWDPDARDPLGRSCVFAVMADLEHLKRQIEELRRKLAQARLDTEEARNDAKARREATDQLIAASRKLVDASRRLLAYSAAQGRPPERQR